MAHLKRCAANIHKAFSEVHPVSAPPELCVAEIYKACYEGDIFNRNSSRGFSGQDLQGEFEEVHSRMAHTERWCCQGLNGSVASRNTRYWLI